MAPKYTVVVRGEEFRLSRRQIEFDSPNYFTDCFLGSFQESSSNTLDRNPHLFAIIVEYLSGYDILPLSSALLPVRMDAAYATRNLLVDADFYGLMGLKRLLTAPRLPPWLTLEWAGLAPEIVTLSEVLSNDLPPGVEYTSVGLSMKQDTKHLPVLVSARNVPLRVLAARNRDPVTGNPVTSSVGEVVFVIDYMQSLDESLTTAVEHPPTIVAPKDSYFQDARMHINGLIEAFLEIPFWWYETVNKQPTTAFRYAEMCPYRLNYAPMSYKGVLWADQIFFTVIKRDFDNNAPTLYVELAHLEARTRSKVLSDLSLSGCNSRGI
ncbi:hypothetical protein OE88DRAFT_1426660 [Heliocybe sulcata]|uniref:BTB domain-containing protein n=1 Tax=Heliocybe sulcata TaxID=5364 RepID=A0A5C3N5S8_9AGAM|nr:hypothetical protein OE88DRAFT_1426660 [Heliocybe sulcata]